MNKRRLPIGIQTFRKIREEDCYYVDKTAYIRRLLDEGTHYFLSRPRRFGKSLFLDTLKEVFEGNEPLFEGLYIHDCWDWSIHYPVLRLSFGSGNFKVPGYVETNLMAQLDAVERRTGVASDYATGPERFAHLLEALHDHAGQPVAVLIDEYDKPILDALEVPDIARANRDFLRGLYAVIKDSDAHIRFTFITGVSKFSKVSLFSGLNNLTDITLDAGILGPLRLHRRGSWTQCSPRNSPAWTGTRSATGTTATVGSATRRCTTLLTSSCYSTSAEFGAYWFETGTPTFLVEMLFKRRVSSLALGEMEGSDELLSTFDVDHIATEALLFQTGYLTITDEEDFGGEPVYRLGYPNREVRQSLNRSLLRYLVRDSTRQMANSVRLYRLLEANDFAGLETLFHAFFASIPYEWYTNNDIADYEGYYASVFYSYFAGLGLDITVEDSSSHGRLDMAVLFNDNVYLFEFKVVEMASAGAAMAQLQERRYADKYRALGQPIYLIGVEFSKDTRNLAAFEVERA